MIGKNRAPAGRVVGILILAGVVGLLGLWLATARAAPARPSPKGRIVIGAVLDITGQGALRGREARDALLLEEQRLNRLRGSALRQILLVTIDTAGKPGAAASGVMRLANEYRAIAIVGPSSRSSAITAAKAAERAEIPIISLSAPEAILRPVRRWIFSTAHPVSLAVRRTLSHMRTKGYRRAAVLVSDDGFGAEGRESLGELAPEMGISVLLNNRHRENEHNLLPYLQKAHIRGAEAFIHWAQGPSRLALARARLALDIRLPIYMAMVSARTFNLKNPGKPLNGVVFPASRVLAADLLPKGSPGLESIQEFRTAFRNRFGHYPDGLSGSAADALRIIEAALGRGDLRREQVRRNIENLEPFEGLTGAFYLSKSDHNGLRAASLVMVRIRKEKWSLDSEKTGKTGKSGKSAKTK
jgi:branched-chain amino acid transport system substrate-binding protein